MDATMSKKFLTKSHTWQATSTSWASVGEPYIAKGVLSAFSIEAHDLARYNGKMKGKDLISYKGKCQKHLVQKRTASIWGINGQNL